MHRTIKDLAIGLEKMFEEVTHPGNLYPALWTVRMIAGVLGSTSIFFLSWLMC